MILGIDTSNYTTSVALVSQDCKVLYDKRRILNVKVGQKGLRQSEAFFQHITNFPALYEAVLSDKKKIQAVCVSDRPRSVEGSYMPCFKAGRSLAQTIAATLNIPIYYTSHQQGHIMAALNGNDVIGNEAFIAVHLSGGTTELLRCEDERSGFSTIITGKTIDISAGQLIDRIGVMCGLEFPCGAQMDKICMDGNSVDYKIKASVNKGNVSFSGAETQCKRDFDNITDKNMLIKAVFLCVCESLQKAIKYICKEENIQNVLFMGGVSESDFLRRYFDMVHDNELNWYYAAKGMSCDNAVGVALLGCKKYRLEHNEC